MLSRRRKRPEPEGDMQSRLRHIETRCDEIKAALEDEPESPSKTAVADLAHLVGYVARLLEGHLKTGEK